MARTDVAIRRLKPEPARTRRVWDQHGLYIEVASTGSKLWRWKYRVGPTGAKREKRLSFGPWPLISLAEARDKRDDARRLLRNGDDPGEVLARLSSDRTFAAVATEWIGVKSKGWSLRHRETVDQRLDNHILPAIGRRPVDTVDGPAVLELLRRLESRGTRETAKRVRVIIGQVMRFAVASGYANADPTPALAGLLEPVKVKHFAAPTDPADVGRIAPVSCRPVAR
jgi:Phage integrase central domain/Arm DNA-binding domain